MIRSNFSANKVQGKFKASVCDHLNDLWLTTDDVVLFDWLVESVFGPDGALGIDCIECGPCILCGAPGCPIGTIFYEILFFLHSYHSLKQTQNKRVYSSNLTFRKLCVYASKTNFSVKFSWSFTSDTVDGDFQLLEFIRFQLKYLLINKLLRTREQTQYVLQCFDTNDGIICNMSDGLVIASTSDNTVVLLLFLAVKCCEFQVKTYETFSIHMKWNNVTICSITVFISLFLIHQKVYFSPLFSLYSDGK